MKVSAVPVEQHQQHNITASGFGGMLSKAAFHQYHHALHADERLPQITAQSVGAQAWAGG